MDSGRRLVSAGLGALFLAVSAACGGGTGGPVEIPPEDLPFTLADGLESAPALPEPVFVYFVARERLMPVTRQATEVPEAEAAMQALLQGPTGREMALGIDSKIPSQTRLLGVRVFDAIADVDLSAEFEAPAPRDVVVLRLAQVVWTLVRLPEVTAVRFNIDGSPISVITDDGAAVQRPVTAPDYAEVSPR